MAVNQVICLDFETGGLSPRKNPAVEIAYQAFEMDTFKPVLEFDSFIIPYEGLALEKGAMDSHGITPKQMASGLDTKTLVKKMTEDFSAANLTKSHRSKPILLGHNVIFDIGFLCYIFSMHKVDISKYLDCGEDYLGNPVPKHICTMQLAKQKWGNVPDMKFNLAMCCKTAGIDHFDAHRAMNDVKVTKELFFFFTNNLRAGGKVSAEQKSEQRVRKHFNF